MKLIKKLECFLFNHDYELYSINPFVDIYNYHSAIYKCKCCGKKLTKEFKDNGGSKPWLM